MSDLISRISLKQSIVVSAILEDKKTPEQIIDDEPSIDAVPVIRCKDCKFFVSDMEWCEADDEHPTRPDAFCSYAERRTDAE